MARRIRARDLRGGRRRGEFCRKLKGIKVPAAWVSGTSLKKFSCDKHKDSLPDDDNGHFTEADYASWLRT